MPPFALLIVKVHDVKSVSSSMTYAFAWCVVAGMVCSAFFLVAQLESLRYSPDLCVHLLALESVA